MAFDKEKYWLERKAENEFRRQWYEWREQAAKMFGKGFLFASPQAFNQRAFKEYLAMAQKAEQDETANQLHAPSPHESEPLAVESVEIKNSVIITDIAGESPVPGTVVELG
jgi:hypothetical protein